MKLWKKIIAYVLALCMVFMAVPVIELRAADGFKEVNQYDTLKDEVVAGHNIKLTADIECNELLTIEQTDKDKKEVDITIDLNGHTLSRNISQASDEGYVIKVRGKLTIKDSVGTGKIAGGKGGEYGGGIYVFHTGTLTLAGGTITENSATNGGGVYNGGTFNMTGGAITGNTATSGGGLYHGKDSDKSNTSNTIPITNITGGKISNNEATNGGGVYQNVSKDLNINGGEVSGNQATENGGGVYLSGASFNGRYSGASISGNSAKKGGGIYFVASNEYALASGCSITGNTASENGGGIYAQGSSKVKIGGTVVIKDNKVGNALNNAYFTAGSASSYARFTLDSENPLSSGSSIYVTLANPSIVTTFIQKKATADLVAYFHPDVSGMQIVHENGALHCKQGTAHTHTYGAWEPKDGTKCVRKCTCGDTQEQNHTLSSNWVQSSDKNYCSKTCSSCKYEQKNMHTGTSCSYCNWTNSCEHTFENVAEKAATCTETGNIAYKKCTACNKMFDLNGTELTSSQIIISATGHSCTIKGDVVAPSCTTEGYTIYKCSTAGCSYTEKKDKVAAKGHSYKDTVTAPTCLAGGYTNHTCTACDYSYKDNYTNVVAHSYTVKISVVEPTCTTAGYTRYKCSTCDKTQDTDITSQTGHTFNNVVSSKEAGCELKCAKCDAKENNNHTGLSCDKCKWKHAHSVNWNSYVSEVKPTCNKAGNTAYYLCNGSDKGCQVHLNSSNEVINSDLAIAPNAHTYVGTWTVSENGCYRVCNNGCGTMETSEHNGLNCSNCGWVHTHTWVYSSNGSQVNAACSINGCDQTASMSISASSSVYNGSVQTAKLEYGDVFSEKTGATIGDIEYYKVDTEGAVTGGTKVDKVKEVGFYYASVKITDDSKTATAVAAFKISNSNAEVEQDNEKQFNESKTSAVAAAEALKRDLDSETVKALVETAKNNIYGTSYDKNKSLKENRAVLDAIIETLKADIVAQRNSEELAKNENSFNEYKNEAKNTANAGRKDSDSSAVIALIEKAKTDIDGKEYDTSKNLAENLATIDAILSALYTAIYNQRKQDADDKQAAELTKNKESFNAYKQAKLTEADGMLIETDSDAVKSLVVTAKNSISALSYDENKSLDENKARVDVILSKLDTDMAVQREKDANPDEDMELIQNKVIFKEYKEELLKKADERQLADASDAVKGLIINAKESINALAYDESKTLDENKACVDAILTKLDTDISSQKKAEEDAKKQAEKEAELKANKTTFEDYKKTVSDIIDSSVLATDSEAVKAFIAVAKQAVTNLSYDEGKTLDENKAMLDTIATNLSSDIKTQREKDANPDPDPNPNPNPSPNPNPVTPAPKPAAKGKTLTDTKTKATYKVKVSSATKGELIYTASKDKNAKTVTVHATIKIDGITYKVTSVAANAFKNNKKITKVTIGSNVKEIGSNAFSGCTSLSSVKLGKNVTSIAANAFSGCKKLKTATFDGKLEKIGAGAFNKCSALTKITLTANIKTIGKNAFNGCKNLKTITIKTTKLTQKTIGANAFKGIHSKAKVKVPASKLKAYKTLLKSKGVKGKKQKITK